MVIHVYRRTILAKNIDDVIICCDEKKFLILLKIWRKSNDDIKKHPNGTDRICEAFRKLKNKNDYEIVVDVQGDEPLISPKHIDKVIEFHKKQRC